MTSQKKKERENSLIIKYFKFMEKYYLAYVHLRVILCSLSSSWTWTEILTIGIHRGRKNLIAKPIRIWSQLPGWT